MKNTLIVVLGPTGVGKTSLSVEIAEHFNAEIISADSRQFYSEMKIGTAVPSDICLTRVRHHFISFISIREYYSSSIFERDVLKLLPSLFARNSLVVMTGGSGMYIDAVCNGIDDIPDVDSAVREKFNTLFREEGVESLRKALKLLDPIYYSKVDLKNHKRIIRALEICEETGRPYSSFLTKRKNVRDFAVLKIGLMREKEKLYEIIDRRVEEMITTGLEEEAWKLHEMKGFNALNSVGYREFFDYFEGKTTKEEAIRLIKRNSRRYAKRQMTWWSRDGEIQWFEPDQVSGIIDYISRRTML